MIGKLIVGTLATGLIYSAYKIWQREHSQVGFFEDTITAITGSTQTTDVQTSSLGALNNPGNIRTSSVQWLGECQSQDKNFVSFISMDYGYRAVGELLRYYYNNHYLISLSSQIQRYAPQNENPTNSYINYVANKIGIDANADDGYIINSQNIASIVSAMCEFEQGNGFIADNTQVSNGINMLT